MARKRIRQGASVLSSGGIFPAAAIAGWLFFLAGCGGDSTTAPRSDTANPSTAAGARTTPADEASAQSEAPRRTTEDQAQGDASGQRRTAFDEGAVAANSAGANAAGAGASSSPPTAAPSAVSRSPAVVQPTPEQLARWTRRAYQPLLLLAARDGDSLGLVTCMDKTFDGQSVLLGGTKVTIWSAGDAEPKHTLDDPAATDQDRIISALAVSPDDKWVAAGDTQGRLTIWSLADQSVIVAKDLYDNNIRYIAVSPDSQQLATITYNNEVSVWSTDSLELRRKFEVADHSLERIEFMTPNLLAVAGEKITSWDTQTGTLAEELSSGRYHYMLARLPGDKSFAFGVDDGLSFWSVEDLRVSPQKLIGVPSRSLLEFSPDGSYLAAADGFAIRIWDVTAGQVVQVIDTLGPTISGMCWLPGANVFVVASENGRSRIWGTPTAGEPLGLVPLHAPVALPESGSQEPATPAQLLAAIDLRSFPLLPGGIVRLSDFHTLTYQAAVDPAEAELFYRHFLGQDGWVESPATQATSPGSIEFNKGGHSLAASFSMEPSPQGGPATTISLTHMGNLDVRWPPKVDADSVQIVFEGRPTVMYKVKLDLLQIETALLRKMHEAGWTAYSRLHAGHSEEPDSRDMEFLKNGTMLRVSVAKAYDDPTAYLLQYSGFTTLHSLPIPPDAGFVEFDGSTAPHLVAITSMSLDEARDFYDREMAAQGWLPRGRERVLQTEPDAPIWLPYMRGQQDLVVGLVRRPDGRTLVRVGDELENSSWQLAKPEPSPDPNTPQMGIEAADIPILGASGPAKYDVDAQSIEFQINATPLATVAEQYTAEFAKSGFTPQQSGIRDADYTFLTFVKDDVEVEFRAHNRDGNAHVSLMGDGVLWTKPLPGPKVAISYESWLRRNRHPAGLDLLDQYIAEMRSLR